jgi:hypothetical protein
VVKKPYFDGDCSHCGKKGHKVLDCRNKHLPAVKRDQGGGPGHVKEADKVTYKADRVARWQQRSRSSWWRGFRS